MDERIKKENSKPGGNEYWMSIQEMQGQMWVTASHKQITLLFKFLFILFVLMVEFA
jgi:hypothetical protein